jgi:hypothetical protein
MNQKLKKLITMLKRHHQRSERRYVTFVISLSMKAQCLLWHDAVLLSCFLVSLCFRQSPYIYISAKHRDVVFLSDLSWFHSLFQWGCISAVEVE